MKLAIVGSRAYSPLRDVADYIRSVPLLATIVSGGAIGVDRTAEQAALELGMVVEVHLPDYDRHGKQAPLVRNCLIAEACDEMRAFWDGDSRGTMHALRAALRLGRPAWVRTPTTSWVRFEG